MPRVVHAECGQCRVLPMLSTVNAEYCQFWVVPMLSTANAKYCQFWVVPMLSTANAEYCQCWVLPILSSANAEYCLCWVLPMVSTAYADFYSCLPFLLAIVFLLLFRVSLCRVSLHWMSWRQRQETITQRIANLKKRVEADNVFLYLKKIIWLWINCLNVKAQYGHTCDTQVLLPWLLKPMLEIFLPL